MIQKINVVIIGWFEVRSPKPFKPLFMVKGKVGVKVASHSLLDEGWANGVISGTVRLRLILSMDVKANVDRAIKGLIFMIKNKSTGRMVANFDFKVFNYKIVG